MLSRLFFAASEPSKVPFYVAGLVLAGWAVVLSAFGLSRPTFPSGAAAQRGVILISFVLMVAALAAAILTDK
jgi:hypothetical protein